MGTLCTVSIFEIGISLSVVVNEMSCQFKGNVIPAVDPLKRFSFFNNNSVLSEHITASRCIDLALNCATRWNILPNLFHWPGMCCTLYVCVAVLWNTNKKRHPVCPHLKTCSTVLQSSYLVETRISNCLNPGLVSECQYTGPFSLFFFFLFSFISFCTITFWNQCDCKLF